jgi:hypothetical protein
MTTGNLPVYGELEQELRGYFGARRDADVGRLQRRVRGASLAGRFTHALLDDGPRVSADAATWLVPRDRCTRPAGLRENGSRLQAPGPARGF